jgi:hypothetical protein
MLIWTLAIVLVLVFAGLGFLKGGIRMCVWLAGLVLAVLLAVPLGGSIRGLMPALGIKNPVWVALMPSVIMFCLINLIFFGFSFFVHHKVAKHYKNTRDDVDRLRWQRVNRRLGASLGVVFATIFFFLIGAVVYAGGYLTVQASPEEGNPSSVKFLNDARKDLAETGMDKAMASISPASPKFYKAADVLGLLYHNAPLQTRLANYPPFLSLGQRPEFQEMAGDKEYNELIFGKAPITKIIDHPRTQAILGNKELMAELMAIDLDDLKTYLRTGKSPKYDETLILGRWSMDKDSIYTLARKMKPDMNARELRTLRMLLQIFPNFSLLASPDNKVVFRSDTPPADQPPADAPPPDPEAARYGLAPAAPAAPAPGGPAALNAAAAEAFRAKAGIPQQAEGTWSEEFSGSYKITFADPNGKESSVQATVREDELTLSFPELSLVFFKE